MSIASEATKLLTNKYFLYFTVFLASTTVLGYLVTNQVHALVFFTLVGLITNQFSKNMAVVLLVPIVATNFLMANKRMREGLSNGSDKPSIRAYDTIDAKDPEIAKGKPHVEQAKDDGSDVQESIKQKIKSAQEVVPSENEPGNVLDMNNPDMNQSSGEAEPMGVGSSNRAKKAKTGSRIDVASTMTESYAQLDEMLGSDSIQKLTGDTQKLMSQQQKLFDTMTTMAPVIQEAQQMLKKFDITGLTNSLKEGIAAPKPRG